VPVELKAVSPELKTQSLEALEMIMDECSERIGRWQEIILDAIARCWVDCSECKDENRYLWRSAKGLDSQPTRML
jgi:hypothetical protein